MTHDDNKKILKEKKKKKNSRNNIENTSYPNEEGKWLTLSMWPVHLNTSLKQISGKLENTF